VSSGSGDDQKPPAGLSPDHRTQPVAADAETGPTLQATAQTVPVAPVGDGGDDYVVGAEVARGGLGRILVGFDKRLQREVALKQLIARDPGADARFLREARITARLQHPSIVPIYEVGQLPDGKPFYAMKLISGRSMRDVLTKLGSLRERLAYLPNVLAVAEAIAFAHAKRIIHRDIKPSNVVLGPFGETLVIDWGLAKDLDDKTPDSTPGGVYRTAGGADMTIPGAIVGTPAFMPPEQARGEQVDARADVYALGALLYDLLAGGPPYEGNTSADVLERVKTAPPRPIDQRSRGVPPALAAIVKKAMARDPGDRYADGAAFAADLSRYLGGQLVSAYQYSLLGRMARFVERHKLPVALSTAFVAALAVVGALAVKRVVRERDLARHERDRAQVNANQMILSGARATLESDPTATLAWLKQYPLDGVGWDEARSLALDALAAGAARHVFQPKEGPWFGAFAPDNKTYALVMDDPVRIELRDLESGKVQRTLKVEFANRLRYSDDGKRIVWRNSRGKPPALGVWNLDEDKPRWFPSGGVQDDSQWDVAADGKTALASSPEGEVSVLDLVDGKTRPLGKLGAPAQQVALSPDGRVALVALRDGTLRTWTLPDGKASTLKAGGELTGIDLSRDGKLVAAYGAKLEVIELASGKKTALVGDPTFTGGAFFSPDGRLLAAVGPDRAVRIFDWRKGTVKKREGHTRDINMLSFSRDGRWLASASRDATVRLWSVTGDWELVLRGHGSQVADASFSPDGRWLATVSADRTTRLWALPEAFAGSAKVHNGEAWDLQLLDGTHTLTVGREDDTATVADLDTGVVHNIAELRSPARILVTPDRKTFVIATSDAGKVGIWHPDEPHARVIVLPDGKPGSVDFSCDGKSLAFSSSGGSIGLIDIADGKVRTLADKVSGGGWLVWAPGCHYFATSDLSHHSTTVWDVAKATTRSVGKHDAVLFREVFVDDHRFVSYDWGGGLHLNDAATGESRPLTGHSTAVMDVAVSPDGKTLATADGNGVVLLWDTSTWQSRKLVGHDRAVYSVAFSTDGKWLLSGGQDRTLRLWDVATGTQIDAIRDGDTVVRALIAPDKKRVTAGDNEGNVRAFRVELAAPATRDPRVVRDWLVGTTSAVQRDDRSLASP
jgi:WD40 repeat protein